MTAPHALQLATRLHAMLLLQLDHGIEPSRMLSDPLYARDVLLVCDAHRGSELAALARQFRVAVAQAAAARRLSGRPAQPGHGSRGAAPAARAGGTQRDDRGGVPAESEPGFGDGDEGRRRTPHETPHETPHSTPHDTPHRMRGDPPDSPRTQRDARGDRDRDRDRDYRDGGTPSTGFSASRFLGSLFGPPAPPDRASAHGARPQRGWFGRWRDTGK